MFVKYDMLVLGHKYLDFCNLKKKKKYIYIYIYIYWRQLLVVNHKPYITTLPAINDL